MGMQTALTRRLGLAHPIIQAPMGGGGSTTALTTAVCEAGALGSVAAAYLSPAQIAEAAHAVRARTAAPFNVNLFAPMPAVERPSDCAAALARLAPVHAELGLPAPALPAASEYSYEDQLAAVLDCGAAVFSFTFGIPPARDLERLRARGMFLLGTATTVDEACALEAAGVDAVVAQGSEAGAHRGTFAASFAAAMIGTMALVPQVVDAVRVPVVASGGIMDGRGVAAALALGAAAVQMGTAFLTSHESGIAEAHKSAILAAGEHETRTTRAFSGREARGIVNEFMELVDNDGDRDAILPYPWQNALTQPMRRAAAAGNDARYLSLWAGQGVRLARREAAADKVARIAREAEETLRRLQCEDSGCSSSS